jgi:hypothetical protein
MALEKAPCSRKAHTLHVWGLLGNKHAPWRIEQPPVSESRNHLGIPALRCLGLGENQFPADCLAALYLLLILVPVPLLPHFVLVLYYFSG